MRIKSDRVQMNAAAIRENRKAALIAKYFDLFCASFEYEGITQAKFRKIMASFWLKGTANAVLVNGAKEAMAELKRQGIDGDASFMALCGYAPFEWNLDGYPMRVTATLPTVDGQIGGVPVTANMGMPTEQKLLPLGKILKVNEDCVIGFALPSMRPIEEYVRQVVNYIVDAEVAIRNNQIAMGLQTTIAATKDSMIRAQNLEDQIMNGDPVKVVTSKTLESIAFPASGISDFTDGQYKLKINYENELKTYLGIRNIGNIEKKERINTDEAVSNNMETDIGADGMAKMIEDFCTNCNEVLGVNFMIRRKQPEPQEPEPTGQDQEDDENDD